MAAVAADVVVAVHLAYLLYVLLGGFLGLLDLRWLWPHAVTVFWGVIGVAAQAPCPLTWLENELRERAGEDTYAGPFIDHYLAGTLYPTSWQPGMWAVAGSIVLSGYLCVILAHREAAHLDRR